MREWYRNIWERKSEILIVQEVFYIVTYFIEWVTPSWTHSKKRKERDTFGKISFLQTKRQRERAQDKKKDRERDRESVCVFKFACEREREKDTTPNFRVRYIW